MYFSFTCHQNIFSIQNEVRTNDAQKTKGMIYLVGGVILTAFITYILFGMLNYFIYGSNILDNILESFSKDSLALSIQGFYIIVMGFSYPLQINPCRLHFIELFGLNI